MSVRIIFRGLILFRFPGTMPNPDRIVAHLINKPQLPSRPENKNAKKPKDGHEHYHGGEIQVLTGVESATGRVPEPLLPGESIDITVIRGKDLKKPLTPLYGSLRSVQVPHLFFVPPGRDERQTTFEASFNGKIHFLGTHVHPHGVSIELYNVSRREQVWKGTRKTDGSGAMQVYSSAVGYPVHAGETYRITAVYENPTPDKIDAMAGLFMLYSRD